MCFPKIYMVSSSFVLGLDNSVSMSSYFFPFMSKRQTVSCSLFKALKRKIQFRHWILYGLNIRRKKSKKKNCEKKIQILKFCQKMVKWWPIPAFFQCLMHVFWCQTHVFYAIRYSHESEDWEGWAWFVVFMYVVIWHCLDK